MTLFLASSHVHYSVCLLGCFVVLQDLLLLMPCAFFSLLLLKRGALVYLTRAYDWYIWSGYIYYQIYSDLLFFFDYKTLLSGATFLHQTPNAACLSFRLLCFKFLSFIFSTLIRFSIVYLILLSLIGFIFQHQFSILNHFFLWVFLLSSVIPVFFKNKTLLFYENQNKILTFFSVSSFFI